MNTQDKLDTAQQALQRIARWFGEFPETGRKHLDGSPMSYSWVWGSNGERDYMRTVAQDALDEMEQLIDLEEPMTRQERALSNRSDLEQEARVSRELGSL